MKPLENPGPVVAAVMRACGATELRVPAPWVQESSTELSAFLDEDANEIVFRYQPSPTGEDLP